MQRISNSSLSLPWAGIVVSIVGVLGGQSAPAADPVIHAAWEEPGDPTALDFDYVVSTLPPASPEFPDVELRTGSDTWQIWSTDSDNPNGIGDIGVISSPHPENFGVKIEGPGEIAGAREIKGIILDPQGEGSDAKYSNLTGGRISGNLTGDLTLQKSSGGLGGAASFTIDGDAEANITVPQVSSITISGDAIGVIQTSVIYGSLTIAGDLLGHIEVTWRMLFAELNVSGNVGPDATIQIADTANAVSIEFGEEGHPEMFEFAGDLRLLTGVEEGTTVTIHGPLTPTGEHTPTIDLNDQDVAGDLLILGGGDGDIINGGAVTGIVGLAEFTTFSGTATFAGVAPNCNIKACFSDIDGTIHITGNMDGTIWMSGSVETGGGDLNGTIQIDRDMSGLITVHLDASGEIIVVGNLLSNGGIRIWRDILGMVTVGGDVEGEILANSSGIGSGEITGPLTVSGLFNGNICGDNLEPDECLPDNIDIACFGPDSTVCGESGPACQCGLDPPEQPEGEEGYAKNRYLSFVPGNTGVLTALRVTLATMPADPPHYDFTPWEGTHVWVGEPEEICENSGQRDPPPWGCGPAYPTLTLMVAECVCEPYYADWPTIVGNDVALHVYGQEIVPGGTYEIQAIHEGCYVGIESNYSDPLVITTSRWGDICGIKDSSHWTAPDGKIHVTIDATACLDKFKNKSDAPIKARCDVDPETPQQKVNISTDVMRILDAYRGQPYPFPMPTPCP